MTVRLPPLIKPDGRFSRIRLSGFLCLGAQSSKVHWHFIESVRVEEFSRWPAFVFPNAIAVFTPEPLPEPMGDEVIHLPEAPLVVGESKVIAPATGHLVDLTHDVT